MATRALAAEIRHDPSRFLELLRKQTGLSSLPGNPDVRCEGSGLVDVELVFTLGTPVFRVGMEAKLDHEATEEQATSQLTSLRVGGADGHLVLLLPRVDDAPRWARNNPSISVITWSETLQSFKDSRLTAEDIDAIPLQKRQVERILTGLPLHLNPPAGWTVKSQRTGSGMPALLLESESSLLGKALRGQLQVAGRPMPTNLEDVRFEYFLGVSIDDPETDLPEPASTGQAPPWLETLIILRDRVIGEQPARYLVNTGRPRAGRSDLGHRKVALAKKFAPESTWLAKGYIDWAIGIKSNKVPREQLGPIAELLGDLAGRWVEVENERAVIREADQKQ